ncbi:DUF167 domain-containing protein [Chachezhania sediminis]|uniref:DUF167 domain-containing protein n=1 Tax=Chachezhania sediminis TaxID=2599291 RepID=UPI00131BC75B|nr:DUF167 domain-containing protein [Chachezhania sediminis]
MAKPKLRDIPDLSALAQDGARIAVKVTPKARKDAIRVDSDILKIAVTAPPEDGKANDAVRTVLAMALGVAPSQLELVQGQTSRGKVFLYRGPGRPA